MAQSKKRFLSPFINCWTIASPKSTYPPPFLLLLFLSKNRSMIIWDVDAKHKLMYFRSIKGAIARHTWQKDDLCRLTGGSCCPSLFWWLGWHRHQGPLWTRLQSAVFARWRMHSLKGRSDQHRKQEQTFFSKQEAKGSPIYGHFSRDKCHFFGYRALACSTALHNGAIIFCIIDAITDSV